jgi:hypothetical protein
VKIMTEFREIPRVEEKMQPRRMAPATYARQSMAALVRHRNWSWRCIGSIAVIIAAAVLMPATLPAASNLVLAPDLSFIDDSSPNFPIRTNDAAEGAIANNRPTLIFIGTSHCWNTAREAERVVDLYPKYKDKVDFIVIDLNNTSPAQRPIVDKYYHGYIPTIVLFDRHGLLLYDKAGETAADRGDDAALEALINLAL